MKELEFKITSLKKELQMEPNPERKNWLAQEISALVQSLQRLQNPQNYIRPAVNDVNRSVGGSNDPYKIVAKTAAMKLVILLKEEMV